MMMTHVHIIVHSGGQKRKAKKKKNTERERDRKEEREDHHLAHLLCFLILQSLLIHLYFSLGTILLKECLPKVGHKPLNSDE